MTQNALSRGRTVQSVASEFLSPSDNRAKAKLLLARQAALGAGQIFDKLPLSMQRNYMTLSENMLATIERVAKVTW
jgi:hypothetical protein